MGKLETLIKEYGKELGFDIVGITSAEPFLRDERAAIERVAWSEAEHRRRAGLPDYEPWCVPRVRVGRSDGGGE